MSQDRKIVRSSCRGCHGVCGVLVHMEGDRVVKVTGDPESPTSRGYICPKGVAAPELLYHHDRLTKPLRRVGERGENKWREVSWDEGLSEIAEKLDTLRREQGTEFFAMAQGTGRPYTEFTMRFANAYGTPNFVAPGHLCYLPRVMASGMTMGRLPVCDIYGFGGEKPKCMLVWGCNITESGSADGMCGGMLDRAIDRAEKVIVVDPRRIGPAEKADLWLQIRPGTDCALALAMINTIIAEDLVDRSFVDEYTVGFEKLVDHVAGFTPEWAEHITRLPAESIRAAAETYATTKPACLQWGNGVDMNACNFHTARALLSLTAITGNIDRPGGDVLWVYPANVKQKSVLVDHDLAGDRFLPPEKAARSVTAGKFPVAPGCHPPSFWESIITGDPYRVRALWIVGSNPLITGTQPLKVERALSEFLELTVVSDFFMTPTAQLADIVLPAATWLEQDDVVSMHKIWCVMARRKVAQIGETRDDRDVMFGLAHRLGLDEAFPWKDRYEYLNWLLKDTGMSFDDFCERGVLLGEMKYRKYRDEGFHTPSGKFEFYSSIAEHLGVAPLPVYREPAFSPDSSPDVAEQFPLILLGGNKIRYFFHSELRQIESLRKRNPDPLVEVHPAVAASSGFVDGDWVWVESPYARVRMRAKLTDGIAPNVVNAQHGWWFPEANPPDYGWKQSNVNLLFPDTGYDPDTGSEPIKCYLCRIYRDADEAG